MEFVKKPDNTSGRTPRINAFFGVTRIGVFGRTLATLSHNSRLSPGPVREKEVSVATTPKIASVLGSVAALLIVVLPAFRPAEKYLGTWLWWLPYAFICAGILYLLLIEKAEFLSKVISSRIFIFGVPSFMALVSTVFYPLADALKLQMQGQDQDDCTILGVNALLSGANPVSTPTYFGNPCSNLLGAIVPHTPFVLSNLMGLAGPIFLLIALFVLQASKVSRLQLGVFVAIIAATPASLELMVNGSDFVFIGFMSLVSVLLVMKTRSGKKLGKSTLSVLTVLVGLVASTRINMPIFALPFGLIMLSRRAQWLLFTIGVSTIVFVPNVLVYLSNPEEFAPLHLIAKGQSLVPGIFYILMVASTIAAVAVGSILWLREKIDELELVLLTFAPHLIFLAFGDLVFNRQFDVFWWEGANYLYLLTPMLTWFAVTRLFSREDSHVEN